MIQRTRSVLAALIIILCGIIVAIVAVGLGDDESGGPDLPACKAAMQAQFDYAMKHPEAPAATRPDACKGVADADLQRFASEIMNDYVNGTP